MYFFPSVFTDSSWQTILRDEVTGIDEMGKAADVVYLHSNMSFGTPSHTLLIT